MSVSFLDSNVFVYLVDSRDKRKQEIAAGLVRDAIRQGQSRISFQVVQETLNTITNKLPVPMNASDAAEFYERIFLSLSKVMPSRELYVHALVTQERYGFHFYDSLIIAAAQSAGCTRLFTEDMQHGQQIEGLTIVNPFLM